MHLASSIIFKKKLYFGVLIVSFVFFLFSYFFTFAATINLYSKNTSYEVNSTFNVDVYISSIDQAMNAVSGVIRFPSDILSVSSISKSDSIMSLWAQYPTFSNVNGEINFQGVIMTPGYKGLFGKIATISFKPKKIAKATLSFSSVAILANDGYGTDITTGSNGITLNITKEKVTGSYTTPPITSETTNIIVTPEIIEAPVITEYPKEVYVGKPFYINGRASMPNVLVELFVQDEDYGVNKHLSTTDNNNKFSISISDISKEGLYQAWVEFISTRGIRSSSSEKVSFEVKDPEYFKLGILSVNIVGTVLLLIIIIIVLLLLLCYRWYKYIKEKNKRKKMSCDVENNMFGIGDTKLTSEEQKAIDQLKKGINN